MTIRWLQKEIYQNKVNRGFNISDVGKEIILMTEELGELAKAYKRNNKKEQVDAVIDLMIYCLGLLEILGVDGDEELKKVIKNNKTRIHQGFFEEKNK
jgi:NTP pyrophosphatase (non-canonical NTP hydrolase)